MESVKRRVSTYAQCREAYSLHAWVGILLNRESPRRGREFVIRRITSAVPAFAAGKQKEPRLG
jgi:GDPmannose 4,6-dehydratase